MPAVERNAPRFRPAIAGLMLGCLLFAGCGGGGSERERPRSSTERSRPPTTPPGADVRQCHAGLHRDGVEFRPLPDRDFGGGCIARDTLQLREVGTPTRNLGAMTCPLASAYARWTRETLQPAARRHFGGQVTLVETMGTYSCRRTAGTGRLSEHGTANAVDIGAFTIDGERRITVLAGWNDGDERVRRFLRDLHAGGCRSFSIVLGPDANADHRDHFHFDMGSRGPYCR